MDAQFNRKLKTLAIPAIILAFFVLLVFYKQQRLLDKPHSPKQQTSSFSKSDFVKFKSNTEFIDYIKKSAARSETSKIITSTSRASPDLPQMGAPQADSIGAEGSISYKTQPERVSQTNVQVIGIDEPDIVKTNGREIYYSQEGYLYPQPLGITRQEANFLYPDRYPQPIINTKVITSFPPKNLRQASAIEKSGNMLYYQNKLIVLADQGIYAYDVSNPQNPRKAWELTYKEGFSYSAARLFNGKLYLVSQRYLDYQAPCPIPMYKDNRGAEITIACTSLYHPVQPIAADVVYSIVKIDPTTGERLDTVSFVGASSGTIVYMSPHAIYVTYPLVQDQVEIMSRFIQEKGADLFPKELVSRLAKIANYDLSDYSRRYEIESILSGYFAGIRESEKLRVQNELQNRLTRYMKDNAAGLTKTGIVRIGFDGVLQEFSTDAIGSVPGRLLNQFALDEYQDTLRVATTSDQQSFYFSGIETPITTTSSNGVYILSSKTLEEKGAVTDLGITEQIYAVRFLYDRAFLVTFRQTDPFYVLDLSNPVNPRRAGELKIPGFSSYLHPLHDNIIIGVGQEAGQVKVSLFDVSDSGNPREIDKYLLSDSWTEVSNNHHAFLHDADHKIFFLPGGRGGYVFSYETNKLMLKKTLAADQVKRAIYIDDYFYIIGGSGIVVYDENSWEQITSLDF